MGDVHIRILRADDEPAFRAFLEPRATSSMFLLSNSRAAGFVDEGQPLQATYVGAFASGELVGIAAHCWNGVLLVQAPADLVTGATVGELATRAVAASGRAVQGFSGPADQIGVARQAFALPPPALDKTETLYALALAELRVPEALTAGRVKCRAARDDELPELVAWRRAYALETLGADDSPALGTRSRREIDELAANAQLWVLEADGAIVAMSAFNARIPEVVQVGGVYTPPDHRRRGHARCVVAGSLLDARAAGVTRAILFTASADAARAYEAIGFARIGEYALVLL